MCTQLEEERERGSCALIWRRKGRGSHVHSLCWRRKGRGGQVHSVGEGKEEGVTCTQLEMEREGVTCTPLEKERERGSHAEAAAKTQLKEERERELGALS